MHPSRLAGPQDADALLELQELTVMTGNLRALGLYLRTGFQVEGLRRQALVRGTAVTDEYCMGKLLSTDGPG